MNLSPERKMQMVCGTDGVDTRGYAYPGMAKITQNEKVRFATDMREHYTDIRGKATGSELDSLMNMAPGTNETFRFSDRMTTPPERIPSAEVPKLVPTFTAWMDEIEVLYRKLMRMIALGMGLDATYFDAFHVNNQGSRTLAIQHYLGGAASASGARLNEHTDYGFITVLFQDQVGGLEVVDAAKGGEFVPAPPLDGCVTGEHCFRLAQVQRIYELISQRRRYAQSLD